MSARLLVMFVVMAAAGCASATGPKPVVEFDIDAGAYTLKISGTGICSVSAEVPREGTAPVTVARSGSVWLVRSVQTTDTFAMTLTTEGAVFGSVLGDVSGAIAGDSGVTMTVVGSLAGNNSGTNVAGGPVAASSGAPAFVVSFAQAGSTSSCLTGVWTLTPR
jgi:hypothetical protein